MPKRTNDTALIEKVRQIVTDWQLARGATYSSGGVGGDLEEKIRLPDDHGRPPPKKVLARETQSYGLPTDERALLKIEEALGMTVARPVRSNLRKQFEKWIGMPADIPAQK